ncbi:MAG TPA: MFS transporter [Bdellovibrionales bacterium]|nr:MAG: hypothetical protein A2Z97_02700 [Bdellovibrionales bacterium GWB1_52_6]OFZ03469.1 MAG: hypothetical protein A2X97_05855 [Bdellovibrionales bacterium GWA1_52_35]OFZ41355.1 MAG: hypothetical protein A2070_05195 [Bdellovibrionales bacterium GWC1_52_8]HAR41742.1 MFS transporter [Bdellovibrionales bacterium]HCM41053.1 MFS transporter [Bdellovibrionales bacterium]
MKLAENQQPMYRFLAVLTAASTVGFQAYSILFNNYAVEVVKLEANGVGLIQSIREIPGFLALLAVFVMLVIKEHRLAAMSVALLGLGTAMTGFLPSFTGLAFSTLIMSFGLHYFETSNQSLTLQYFSKGSAPLVLGRLRSLAAVSSIASGFFIWLLGHVFEFKAVFFIVGMLVSSVGVWAFRQEPTHADIPAQKPRMVLKKKYLLFYVLTFLSGARRQIFIVFSMFLLVKHFHFSVHEMAGLFIVNNVIAYLMNPIIGRAIVRFGERKISSIEYLGVVIIFLIYAFTTSKLLVTLMYIADSLLFNFSVAIRTYFQKISDPADISSSMAVGFTINHVAAVFLPALGGLLWMIDYRIPFLIGAALGVVSLVTAQRMVSSTEAES